MDIRTKLKIVMFLQFFIWGSYLITLGSYMFKSGFDGAYIGAVYGTMGIASLFMPSLLGIVADRWIPANRLYMLCHLVGGVSLCFVATASDGASMYLWMLVVNLAFMPTIAISNSVSYFCLENEKHDVVKTYPPIRVYGTVGFIIAMWAVSLLKLEVSNIQFYIAAGASILLCLVTALLPTVRVNNSTNQKQSFVSMLGLDAFVLLKQPRMAVFFLFSLLLGAVLQISNSFGNPFLADFGKIAEFKDSFVVQYPSILLSISQISEVVFILFVPFFLKRYGIKKVMLISILAWVLRFGLFVYGDPSPFGFVLLLLSMIVYGCAFDFFNISGSLYVEKTVSKNIRNSAQGLFMMMTNGFGVILGSSASGWVVDQYTTVNKVIDWQSVWLVFAAYSAILAVVFMFVFKSDEKELAVK